MASSKGRSMIVSFEARTDALRRQVSGAESILTRFQKTAGRVGAGMKAAMTSATGMVAGVTGVGAAAAAAAKGAMDFEAQVSKVRATGSATGPQLKALETQAMSMAKTFGVSGTQAMSAVEALAKAGVSTTDIMGGGLQGALSLAAAGEMDVGESAETASSAMAQFGLKGSDVGHIADVLAQGANLAQGGVSDLSQALSQGGMVASQMGMSLDQTVGVLAEFANKGLQGSDAGTSLKTMLQRLSNPAADAQKEMQKLGIAAYDSQGKFVGLSNFAGQLQTSMRKLTPAQRDAAMATIFGSDAVRAASILYTDGAKGVASWATNVGKSGAAMQTARTNTDNLKGDLDKAKASFQNAFIVMGESSQGPLRSVVQGFGSIADAAPGAAKKAQEATSAFGAAFKAADGDITSSGFNGAMEAIGGGLGQMKNGAVAVWQAFAPLITQVVKLAGGAALGALVLVFRVLGPLMQSVGRFIQQHAVLFQSLAAAALAGAAALKGVQTALAIGAAAQKFAAGLKTIGTALRFLPGTIKLVRLAMVQMNMAWLASPITWVIVGIVALVAAFTLAYKKSETFRNIINGALNGIKVAALAVAGWFSGPFVGFFVAAWNGIKAGASAIGSFFTGIWNGLKAGATAVGSFFTVTVPGSFTAAWNIIRNAFMVGVNAVSAVLTILWNAISNTWAFKALQSIVITVIAIVRWTIVNFVTGIQIIWSAFWNGLTTVATVVWNAIRAAVAVGAAAVRAVIVPVINGIRAVWNAVWGAISGFFVGVWNNIHAAVALRIVQVQMVIVRVMNIIRALWAAAWGAVRAVVAPIWNSISGTVSRIFNGIRARISSIMSGISGLWSRGWNGIKNSGVRIMNSVSSAFSRILGGIKSAFSNAVGAIGKIWNGIKKIIGAPITFVIDKVLNNGIIHAIRVVQGFFGVAGKNQMPTMKVPKFRRGGRTDNTGYVDAPFSSAHRDNLLGFTPHGLFAYEGGEFIVRRSSTARAPRMLNAINAGLLDDSSMPRFRNGGYTGGRGRLTPTAAARINAAAASLGWTLQLAQQGWNPANGLSGTSHAGDAVDVSGPAGGTRLWSIRDALRRQSWAAWVRGPRENFSWHVHAIPLAGAGDARGSAVYQRQAYAAGGDGLHGLSTPDVYARPSGTGGSWLGQVVTAVKSFAERMADKAKSVFGGIASPVTFLKNKITGFGKTISSKLGGNGWASTLARIPGKLWQAGSKWVSGKWSALLKKGDDAGDMGGRNGNVESWRPVIAAAMARTGFGSAKADVDRWLSQVGSESSGNSKAAQGIRDVNSGVNAAYGLLQVIPATFAQYRDPSLPNDRGNPLANAVAAMNYVKARYGSRWRSVIGHGHGYAAGTLSAAPGWAWVGERGPELMRLSGGEQILPSGQSLAWNRRASHVAVADTSGNGPALSDAQWDELLDAIRDGQSPVVVDGATLREAIRSEMRLAARQESNRRSVLR